MDLGNRYLSELKYPDAVNAFTKAIDIEPKRSQAYEGRADAYSYMQEYDLAIADYERAIELAPDHGEEIQIKLDDLRASSGPESAVESEVNAGSSEKTAAPEERNDNIAAPEEKNAGSTIPVLKLEEIIKGCKSMEEASEKVIKEVDDYAWEFWTKYGSAAYLAKVMTEEEKIAWGAAGEAGLKEDISPQQVADACHCSLSSLQKLFR